MILVINFNKIYKEVLVYEQQIGNVHMTLNIHSYTVTENIFKTQLATVDYYRLLLFIWLLAMILLWSWELICGQNLLLFENFQQIA